MIAARTALLMESKMTTVSKSFGGQAVPAGLLKNVKVFLARTAAERQLNSLDDRMLADIGLRRGDIRHSVWGN
jgi:uncharacterized protein YjiS (DUF1127 family)